MELQWLIVGILMRYFVFEYSHLKYINLVYLSIISGYVCNLVPTHCSFPFRTCMDAPFNAQVSLRISFKRTEFFSETDCLLSCFPDSIFVNQQKLINVI